MASLDYNQMGEVIATYHNTYLSVESFPLNSIVPAK